MAGGDGVDCLPGGERFVGPEGLVPAAAEDPGAGVGGGGESLDALEHIGEGACTGEIDGEHLLLAGGEEVDMGVVEAGHDEGAVEVDDRRVRGFCGEDLAVGACGGDDAVADGKGGNVGGGGGGVGCLEVCAGEDPAAGVDGVGACGAGRGGETDGNGRGAEGDGQEDDRAEEHERSVSGAVGAGALVKEVRGVEDGEEQAAEGDLAAGGVVPLG